MSKRVMPPAGYYLRPAYTIGNHVFREGCVYVSGTCKGNFYYEIDPHGPQWNYLTWTCVPGKKVIATMTYSINPPPGFPPHP